jgi:hypothetical protein
MAGQKISQGNIFGRIGSALGQGLAQQLPKEIERGRLSSSLKNLNAQSKKENLSPFEQFTGLVSSAHDYPQVIQSGSDILRQQGMLQGAQGRRNQDQEAFNEIRNARSQNPRSENKGLVNTQNTQAALEPAIPKQLGELQDRAVQLHDENPGLYPDWKSAMEGAALEDQQRVGQNKAQQEARHIQKGLETDIRKELAGLRQSANVEIPDNIYQKIEDKTIDAIRNGEDELTAAKEGRDSLDKISRDYKSIDAFGNLTLLAAKPKEVKNAIKGLRKAFKDNGDTAENLADSLVAKNGLSNKYANYLANPPEGKIDKTLSSAPSLKRPFVLPIPGVPLIPFNLKTPNVEEKSLNMSKKLGAMLEKNDSPLAIGYLLEQKGYDPEVWRNYLSENQKELNLSQSQARELQKTDKTTQGLLNDTWLKAFGGP